LAYHEKERETTKDWVKRRPNRDKRRRNQLAPSDSNGSASVGEKKMYGVTVGFNRDGGGGDSMKGPAQACRLLEIGAFGVYLRRRFPNAETKKAWNH